MREIARGHENESKSVSEGGRKLALAILYRAQEYSGSEEWKQLRCSIDQDLLVLMYSCVKFAMGWLLHTVKSVRGQLINQLCTYIAD